MNNVFDFKRFGKYFLFDLRRARNNYGISLLIIGLMPVMFYLLFQFSSLISGNGIIEMPQQVQIIAIFAGLVAVMLGAGPKIYGRITEKRAGSDYLMLPASTLEKWLSMVLIVCVVLPIALFALLIVSDGIMSLLFPNTYGGRIFEMDFARGLIDGIKGGEQDVYFNLPAGLFLNWCEVLLIFTLGAVCFKKAKVAKTLLCIIGFGMVISPLMLLIFGSTNIDTDWLMEHFSDPDRAVSTLNWTLSILYTVVLGGLLAGLYFRLRTLKH